MADEKKDGIGFLGGSALAAVEVPSVTSAVRWLGPYADRFVQGESVRNAAEALSNLSKAGVDKAAVDTASRFLVPESFRYSGVGAHLTKAGAEKAAAAKASIMREFANEFGRVSGSAQPAATASTSAAAPASRVFTGATRETGEALVDFMSRKVTEAGGGGVGSSVKELYKKAAGGVKSWGRNALNAKNLVKSGVWALATHGAIEGISAIADWVSADNGGPWYERFYPKGGVNPDEVQHALSGSLKRFASGLLTFGMADWGREPYDPKSDPGSWAAKAAYAQENLENLRRDLRDSRYRRVKSVTSISPEASSDDVLSFLSAAKKSADELDSMADTRSKSVDLKSNPEARKIVSDFRSDAKVIRRDALSQVRKRQDYRTILERQVDNVIIPSKFQSEFGAGVTYRPGMKISDPARAAAIESYRSRILGNPEAEFDILTAGGK